MPADLGQSVPHWSGRRAAAALRQVKARGRRLNLPCCLCGQPIDYSIPSTEESGCTVQHVRSRKHFPHLTWDPSNWAPAHRGCNSSDGAGENLREQGVTSTDW